MKKILSNLWSRIFGKSKNTDCCTTSTSSCEKEDCCKKEPVVEENPTVVVQKTKKKIVKKGSIKKPLNLKSLEKKPKVKVKKSSK